MNNTTFGDDMFGYYETVAGGAGAVSDEPCDLCWCSLEEALHCDQGEGWHGRSGVHTHMTNTRMTDPEILERRCGTSIGRPKLHFFQPVLIGCCSNWIIFYSNAMSKFDGFLFQCNVSIWYLNK